MNADPPPNPDTFSAKIELKTENWQLQTQITVTDRPTKPVDLLPMVQSLANAVVDATVQDLESKGKRVSCQAGCNACCRQLIAVSEVEARAIRDLVDGLPEPRRSEIRHRFAAAKERLDAADLLTKLRHPEQWQSSGERPVQLEYFDLGLHCPFLEGGLCSIYQDRPISCREYLVTSPAENCENLSAETVDCVKLPFKTWTAFARLQAVNPDAKMIRWVPLILALEWVDTHLDGDVPRPGLELVEKFFGLLTQKTVVSNRSPSAAD